MNLWGHMTQKGDLAMVDIVVQVDYEPPPGQWPLHSAALDSTTTTDFPAK